MNYTKEAGIDHSISPHKLRHFLFTWMKKKGVDDALIQPYSGHDSRQSLEIYSKLSLGDCQPEYEKKIKGFPIWSYNVPNALVLNTGPKHAEGSTFAEIEHLIGSDIIIRRAFEAIDQAAWTEEELNTYDKITKIRLDNLAVEQQKIEDAEIRVKVEIAKNLLTQKVDINTISTATGLSLEEISKL